MATAKHSSGHCFSRRRHWLTMSYWMMMTLFAVVILPVLLAPTLSLVMAQEEVEKVQDTDADGTLATDGDAAGNPSIQYVEFTVQLSAPPNGNTTGTFVVELHPEWAPIGAARFMELIDTINPNSGDSFFEDVRFFRVVPDFIVQFGISGDPTVSQAWEQKVLVDDPRLAKNERGTLTFATSGPDSRTTQLFFNLNDDNVFLDRQGFTPFARVVQNMAVVDALYAGYGESPSQSNIQDQGNAYLQAEFPSLSYILDVKRTSAPLSTSSAASSLVVSWTQSMGWLVGILLLIVTHATVSL